MSSDVIQQHGFSLSVSPGYLLCLLGATYQERSLRMVNRVGVRFLRLLEPFLLLLDGVRHSRKLPRWSWLPTLGRKPTRAKTAFDRTDRH
jgi:hypothetical protein